MLKRVLMRGNHLVRVAVFRRRAFIRTVFGVELVADTNVQSYCEWATILMRLLLPRYLHEDQVVLDVGTGAHAVLAIYVKKHLPSARVLATEMLPDRVGWARRTIARNMVDVQCIEADLFQGITQKFDLILLTPPAIPSADLRALGYQPRHLNGHGTRLCWSGDGGVDGLAVIRPFFEQLSVHLTPRGRALVCVNPAHCRPRIIAELCVHSGLLIERIHRLRGIMNAYVIAGVPIADKTGSRGGYNEIPWYNVRVRDD